MDAWQKMLKNEEQILRVDSTDTVLGTVGKIEAHRFPGTLHRAFTLFLFDPQGKVLLTQRSQKKPLWPLWWDAACSSHQWENESDERATLRRLPFELGLSPDSVRDIHFAFSYEYHAVYNQEWAENEVNHIVTGILENDPVPNPDEVAKWEWKTEDEITQELKQKNHRFAPWFGPAWETLLENIPKT